METTKDIYIPSIISNLQSQGIPGEGNINPSSLREPRGALGTEEELELWQAGALIGLAAPLKNYHGLTNPTTSIVHDCRLPLYPTFPWS